MVTPDFASNSTKVSSAVSSQSLPPECAARFSISMISAFLKILLLLLEPLGLVWLLLTALVVMQLRASRWRLVGRVSWLIGTAWMVLSLATCTELGVALLASLERPWLSVNREELPKCDALLVLGGGMRAAPSRALGVDFLEESDRVMTGVELVRMGKASALVVSGGKSNASVGGPSEAEATRLWVTHWQLVQTATESLGVCDDTHDEAIKMKALAEAKGWKRILLVTSASHMSRSQATFQKAGLDVVCCPGSYQTALADEEVTAFSLHLPGLRSLGAVSFWMHESIGWWVYRVRGWV
jgi:uncharacterized SAM-binding protein YcdF (DUF218 family)